MKQKGRTRKIILGSMFAIFILMLTPSISAIEFKTIKDTNKQEILNELQNMKIWSRRINLISMLFGWIQFLIQLPFIACAIILTLIAELLWNLFPNLMFKLFIRNYPKY